MLLAPSFMASSAKVEGTLVEEGGPPPGASRPVAGRVELVGARKTYFATAGGNGHFSLHVPIGTYLLRARPSGWQLPGYPCGGERVTASSSHTVRSTVVCRFP